MSTREQPKLKSKRSSHSSIHNSYNWQHVTSTYHNAAVPIRHAYANNMYKNATQQVLLIRHVNVTINSFVTYSRICGVSLAYL